MKHGDKTKAGSVKGRANTSSDEDRVVEAGVGAAGKGRKGGAPKGRSEAAATNVKAGSAGTNAAGGKAEEKRGKRKPISDDPEDLTFSNPAVGAAFERAVSSYPSALKRLVD